MSASTRQRLGSFASAIAVLSFTLAYLLIGYLTLDDASRAVPTLAAIVTIALVGVELARLSASGKPETRRAVFRTEAGSAQANAWAVILSVIGVVAGIYVAGFLLALPIYITAAITFVGRRPVRVAVLAAVLTTLAIFVAFELALSLHLFRGVLLT